MKKFSKLFVIALAFVLTLSLTACKKDEKSDEKKASYSEYIGYQFSRKDSWRNELAITVRTLENDKLTWTYTNSVDNTTLYSELTTEFKDGSTSFNVKGDTDDKVYSFDYTGTLTLKDGALVVTYSKGQLTVNSSEGGSTSHIVDALEENAKTFTLTKVVDPA